jgi:hypothetical protein
MKVILLSYNHPAIEIDINQIDRVVSDNGFVTVNLKDGGKLYGYMLEFVKD